MRLRTIIAALLIAAVGTVAQAAQAQDKAVPAEAVKIAVWKVELEKAVAKFKAALERGDVSQLLSEGDALLYQFREMEIAYREAKVAKASEEKLDEIADKYADIASRVDEIRRQVWQKVDGEARAVRQIAEVMADDPALEQTTKEIISPIAGTLEAFANVGEVAERLLATADIIHSSLVSSGFLDTPGTIKVAMRAASRLALERKAEAQHH